MGFVAKYEWNNWDCTYAQVYLSGWVDNTVLGDTEVIFGEWVYATNNSFFYSIPTAYFLDNTEGSDYGPLVLDMSTHYNFLFGDASTVSLDLTYLEVYAQGLQQESFPTMHYCAISDFTGQLVTNHSAFIDRTEYFDSSGSLMFWNDNDVFEVIGTSNIPYFYDKEPYTTYGLFPEQTTGKLHIKRVTDATTGVEGYIHIDATGLSGVKGINLLCYVDRTASDPGPYYLGHFNFPAGRISKISKSFRIPDDMMMALSDSSFNGGVLYLTNTGSFTSSWGLLDSYVTFRATDTASLDTSHEAQIGAVLDLLDVNGAPIYIKAFNTDHRARLTKGQTFVLDYYTPGTWWSFNETEVYTVDDWNDYERVSQYFGRFFHSPIYFNAQLPDFGYMMLKAKAGGKLHILQDYPSPARRTNIIDYTYNKTTGFSVLPYVGTALRLYDPVISPEVVQCDSTLFKVDTFIRDNTIGVIFREKDGTFNYWNDSKKHPFMTDQTFYLGFYGKKG